MIILAPKMLMARRRMSTNRSIREGKTANMNIRETRINMKIHALSLLSYRNRILYLYESSQNKGRFQTMIINSEILQEIKKNNNLITTSQILQFGYSKALLTKYVNAGLLERYSHGVYTLPDAVTDDMYALMLRSSKIIFSHDTALFLNGQADRTPFRHSITIPSDSALPVSIKDECVCYYIKRELHGLGMIEKTTTFGNTVRCYNMERTICDLLRSRSRLDEETVISSIKNYAASNNKNLNRLADYAKLLRIDKVLKRYMEVLI